MMKLYGALASPYVARVALAARYKGIDLPLEMPADGLKSPAYLARNPFGKMPTLEQDGHCVIESQVICEYLDDIHPSPSVVPGNPLARARARTLARAVDLYVSPEGSALFRQMDPSSRDETSVATAKEKLVAALGRIDGLMSSTGPWAAGEFSVADCTLLPYIVLMQKTIVPVFGVPDPTQALARTGAWWVHVERDPLTAAFTAEYGAAVDDFLARMRGG